MAAVSTGTQVTQIITSMISGLMLGGTILVGKYTGMREEEQTRKTIGTTLTLFAGVAVILTGLFLWFTDPILTALKTPSEAFELAGEYVRVCACGIFFICGYNAVSAILRGYGDSKRPMLFVALSCVLNIIGDVLLVKYADMGVRGVALATILSQGVSMCCAIVYLNHKRFIFRFTPANFRIDWHKAGELARVGIPISSAGVHGQAFFFVSDLSGKPAGGQRGSGSGGSQQIRCVCHAACHILASSTGCVHRSELWSRQAKAREDSGIRRPYLCGAGVRLFLLWAQLSPQTMIGIFTDDGAVIREGIPFFRSCSFDYLAVSVVFSLNGYLNGRSKTVFTMISCCFGALCLRMPLIWLAYTWCPDNLLLIGAIAPAVSGIMAVYTFGFVIRQFRRDLGGRTQ